mgnify:CR=1 FL=1
MNNEIITLRGIYGICAVLGILATMYFNALFIIEHQGFSWAVFIDENYVNHASSSIMNDVLVVVLTFLIWSFKEARRLSMPHWWFYVLSTFGLAIAFSFPFFLYMRERYLAKTNPTN